MCSQTGQSRRRVYHPEEQLLQGQLSAGLNKNYATQTLFSKFRGKLQAGGARTQTIILQLSGFKKKTLLKPLLKQNTDFAIYL